jgi:hypothetical protein
MLSVAHDAMQFAGYHTEQGRVVLLAGENPDDTAAKLQVACDYWHLNPATLTIDIIPGAFDLAGNIDATQGAGAASGPSWGDDRGRGRSPRQGTTGARPRACSARSAPRSGPAAISWGRGP